MRAAASAAREAAELDAAAELAELEEVLGTGRGSGGMRRRLGERQKRAVRRAETDVSVEFCSWLAQAFRDLAALSAGAGPESISAPDRAADLAVAAARRPTAHWLRMADEALGPRWRSGRTPSPASPSRRSFWLRLRRRPSPSLFDPAP